MSGVVLIAATWASGQENPSTAPAASPTERPLMMALDAAGIGKALKDENLNVYGFVEGSYEYNFDTPTGHTNTGRIFDYASDKMLLNQADLTFERTVDYTKDRWDVGGRVEFIYGSDSRFIHSSGLDFYGPNDASTGPQMDPENQFDLNQAYIDVVIPAGTGLRVRIGKFVTLLGYETINPTTNSLYTHSYMFGYAIPFTQTGVLGTYNISDSVTLNAGVTRGWEQSLKDNNGDAMDFLGGVSWTASHKLTVSLNNSTGPERAGNSSDYRTVWDLVAVYNATDAWSFGMNADLGFEQEGAGAAGGAGVAGADHAWWGGLAGYAGYKFNDYLTVNSRLEWFDDQDNARGLGTNVYEGTLGLTVTPAPEDPIGRNLKIRPEIRCDYAQDPIFSGGTDHSQVTLAIEAYFTY